MPPAPREKRTQHPKLQEQLSDEVLQILRQEIQIEGTTLTIFQHLDRTLYEQVNEVLERCGGKYRTKKRLHEFPYNPSPLLQAVIESRQMPPKNPLQFFHSTSPVLASIREKLTWSAAHGNVSTLLYRQEAYGRPMRILEPSAGVGHIAELLRELLPTATLHCCECDPFRRSILVSKGFTVVEEPDFLAYHAEPYDLIVMNSPFSIGDERDTYIKHILHAFDLLVDAEESDLLTIAPVGFTFTEQQPFYNFYSFVLEHGCLEELPQDAFKDAGAHIRTMLLWLGKKSLPSFRDMDEPVNGYANGRIYSAWEWIYADEESAKDLEKLLDRMVAGELIVYSDGTAAPKTYRVLKEYCQQVARTARHRHVHIPLLDGDYDHLIALILRRFEENYPYCIENLQQRQVRERERQLQEAEQAIRRKEEALARDKAKIIELAQANRRRKQEIVDLAAAYKVLQIRVREEPPWLPPERPVAPVDPKSHGADLGPLAELSAKGEEGRKADNDLAQLALPL